MVVAFLVIKTMIKLRFPNDASYLVSILLYIISCLSLTRFTNSFRIIDFARKSSLDNTSKYASNKSYIKVV